MGQEWLPLQTSSSFLNRNMVLKHWRQWKNNALPWKAAHSKKQSPGPHSWVSQSWCVFSGHFQSEKRAWHFCEKGKARWCLSFLFLFLLLINVKLSLLLRVSLPVFWLFLAYSWKFLRIFNWFFFIISYHLSVNMEKAPKDIKTRRLPVCSIRHLLPFSIKLIFLLITRFLYTLPIFCFQDFF